MRDDLVVPGEDEEKFMVVKDTKVITIPFTPLEERMAVEKPELMDGLLKLRELLGAEKFEKYISTIHNINKSGNKIMFIADTEIHRTHIERECIRAIEEAFDVEYVRIVAMG